MSIYNLFRESIRKVHFLDKIYLFFSANLYGNYCRKKRIENLHKNGAKVLEKYAEAMESAGSTKLQCFRYAIMPQILPAYFSSALWSFEVNVRYAAILGYVGAGGIGLILNEKIGWREYDKVGMILLMLFVTVVIIEYISQYIRERLS